MNSKKQILLLMLNCVVSQIALCDNRGTNALDQIIYTTNEEQYNEEGMLIRYDWNKIFEILDLYKINPNTYFYTKESQYGWKPTLLELAAKNDAQHAVDTLIKKYKARYPNTKEALFQAIYDNYCREFREGRRVNELLLMRYGAGVKWHNEEEFLRFILDPRFINHNDNPADVKETKDIIRKVLENSKMVIHWNTYKKVIEQPWGEWWHWGVIMGEKPQDNPNNKVVEDYINKKSNKFQ